MIIKISDEGRSDIRRRRRAAGWNYRQLAALCGVSPQTISGVEEHGKCKPGTVVLILAALEGAAEEHKLCAEVQLGTADELELCPGYKQGGCIYWVD